MRRPGLLLAGLLTAVMAAGCSGDRDADPAPPTCSSPVDNELQGTGSLWALFFPRREHGPPVVAGEEAKIVWRIGGSGDFTVAATGPDGAVAELVWGPTHHPSSTWNRPGTEYGTGLVFPNAGCWTVTAERADGERGELHLTVAQPAAVRRSGLSGRSAGRR